LLEGVTDLCSSIGGPEEIDDLVVAPGRREQRSRRVCADVRGGDGHERRAAGRQEVMVDALSFGERQQRGDVVLKIARS
jgi:hypothetical protein